MEVKVLSGQTLWDVAVATKGSWQSGIDVARSAGISMTDLPKSGTLLPVPANTYDRALERYAQAHRLEPATATAYKAGAHTRIFTSAFSEVFS